MNHLLIETAPPLDAHHPLGPDLQATLWQVLNETLQRMRAKARPHSPPLPAAEPALRPREPTPATPVRLSQREREVLQRIAAGDSNKVIARTFDLSPHTVKRHVANILDKLGASSRGQAAAWWRAQA